MAAALQHLPSPKNPKFNIREHIYKSCMSKCLISYSQLQKCQYLPPASCHDPLPLPVPSLCNLHKGAIRWGAIRWGAALRSTEGEGCFRLWGTGMQMLEEGSYSGLSNITGWWHANSKKYWLEMLAFLSNSLSFFMLLSLNIHIKPGYINSIQFNFIYIAP